MTADVPESVPCVCGSGDAEQTTQPVSEPYTFDASKRAIHHHYKHTGCPYGGTIVTVDGALYRRVGPVFQPARYGLGNVPSVRLATDGGERA